MVFVSKRDIEQIIAALTDIAKGRTPQPLAWLPADADPELSRLVEATNALIRECHIYADFAHALAHGDFSFEPPKSAMHHPLKTLQANLRHLTWKTHEIAKGHLTPRLDFMGEFSTAFNQMVDRLQHQALHDPLTGLPNRKLLSDRLAHTLALAKRESKKVALLYVDLDGFKLVNDSLGHTLGDVLLGQVAARFVTRVRESDTLARLGGDEFAVVLTHIPSKHEAAMVAKDLLNALDTPFQIEDHSISIGASIGISLFPEHGADSHTLLQHADNAMYAAKRNGKNGMMFYTAQLGSEARERLSLESQLREAIGRGEISVHYQPEYEVSTHRLIRFEALARWTHPTLGPIPPMKFIPVAEESGIIMPLGAYVMERACAAAVQWQSLVPEPVQVAVNVSAMQFSRNDFVDEVSDILRRTGLPPRLLQIEITESVTLHGSKAAVETMNQLIALGINLALDDFGTGYSSLSYLSNLPFAALKIDRSFVRKLDSTSEGRAMIHSLIGLARNLGMRVIVEGVEKPEQLQLLRELGADEVQGYLLGRPTGDPESILAMLLNSQPPPFVAPQPQAVSGPA